MKDKVINGTFARACSGNDGAHCTKARPEEIPSTKEKDVPPTSVFLTDPANICTFTGVLLSTVSLAYIWPERYNLVLTLSMVANVLDISDGQIARSIPGRHPALGKVGAKLDTYSDMVSHFVVPACVLMRISGLNILCMSIASCWVMAGVFRQSFFEVTGRLDNGQCVFGVTSDHMPTIMGIAMHLLPVVGQSAMTCILSICTLAMIYGALTNTLRSRRYFGYDLLWAELFNISLTISCLVLMLILDDGDRIGWCSFAGVSFGVHLLLAYPCYFRFVELNT